jgi:DNA-binding CsgD family transcriptional regulator
MSRTDESERILAAFARRPPRSQLVRGPTGIGKTTLATEVCRALAAEGREIVPVAALAELSEIPLAAFAPVLSARKLAGGDVAERVQALIALVGARARDHLIVVDDAPLLDDVSAGIIYQLVRVFGVPALLTARDEHRLRGPLARLLHEDLIDVTELVPLAPHQIVELVEKHLEEHLRPDSARSLVVRSAGNPLFLRELVTAAQRDGRVRVGPFGAEVDATALPAHVLDSVGDRIGRLRDRERRTLRLLAISQPWNAEAVAGADAASVEVLLADGAARRDETGRVRVAHPLYTEAVLHSLEPAERSALAAAAARILRGTGDPSDRFTAAHLSLDAAPTPEEASSEFEWAAGVAASVADPALAVRFAERALRGEETFRGRLVLAAGLSALGEADRADAEFVRATELASGDGEVVLAALRRGQHLAYRRRDLSAAIRCGHEARERLADGTATALDAELAKWRLMAGEIVQHGASDDTADPLARLGAGLGSAMFATMVGDTARALAAVDGARPLVELMRADQPHAGALLDLSEFLVEIAEGRIERASAYAREHRLSGSPDEAGMWSYALALIELHAGRAHQARRLAELAVRQLEWRDFTGLVAPATALAATAAAVLADLPTARGYLARLDDTSRADIKVRLQAAEAEAWIDAREGRAVEAERLVAVVCDGVREGHALLAALTASAAVRLLGGSKMSAALSEAATASPAPFVQLVAAAARAAAARDAGAVLKLVPGLRAAGLTAAARRLTQEAASLAPASSELRRRAQLLLADLDTVVVDAAVGTRGVEVDDARLSEREWQIALAAGRRERSREIADRLGISVRTVDNHLAKIYRKLGVSGRDELAQLLATQLRGATLYESRTPSS